MATLQNIRTQHHFHKGKFENRFGNEHQAGGQGDKAKIGRLQFISQNQKRYQIAKARQQPRGNQKQAGGGCSMSEHLPPSQTDVVTRLPRCAGLHDVHVG